MQDARDTRGQRLQARRDNWFIFVALLIVAAPRIGAAQESDGILVFAAASLTNVMDDLEKAYASSSKVAVKSSYAASSVLAKQIEAGAPADVFFSADSEWMDYLQQRKLLQPETRRNVLGNKLVLIAPASSKIQLRLDSHTNLAAALGRQGKLATGDPDSVPVGKYAAAALRKLGLWDQVSGHLVRAENVRSALAFVARAEAELGVVYLTDARIEKNVRVVAEFPADSYPPIVYPVALTRHAGAAAMQFEAFITSSAATAIYRKYGFEPLY